jgi:16S rRNA (guanine527-N7)-methyltransferase
VRVVEARAERPSDAAPVDEVTARALAPLPELVALAAGWLGPEGRVLAMKGPGYEPEVESLPAGWSVESIRPLAVPDLDADRVLVVVKRSPAGPHGDAASA